MRHNPVATEDEFLYLGRVRTSRTKRAPQNNTLPATTSLPKPTPEPYFKHQKN